LGERLNKFGLQLSAEKTRIIRFTRFRKEENVRFDFLGFEFRWGVSKTGRDIIKKRTARKKLRKSVAKFKEWCKESRNNRLRNIFSELNTKLRGYYNHYGIIGNYASLYEFYTIAMKTLYKWLNRRSQRRSFNLVQFWEVLVRYRIERPKITESRNYQLEFDYSFV